MFMLTVWSLALVTAIYATDEDVLKKLQGELKLLGERVNTLEEDNTKLREEVNTLKMTKQPLKRRQTQFPEEVGFTAQISHHLTSLGNQHPVVFDKVISNIGNGYDAISGMFIAPVPGIYMFFTNIMSEQGSNYIETEITRNGSQLVELYSGGSTGFDSSSNMVVTSLKRGEHVWVRVHNSQSSNFAIHCCFSTFTGYLLKVDEEGLENILG